MSAPDWVTEALAEFPPLGTTEHVTTLLQTSQRNLYRLVSAGRIHAVRAKDSGSSRLLFPKSSVEKYLRSLEVE
jgi:excisionase family DNA binding protein